jgi:hypothetical protein
LIRWRPLGVLVPAPPPLAWATSHAALPAARSLPDGRVRLYFSSRDERGRSKVTAAELDLDDPASIRYRDAPVVDVGPLGSFDDSGATMSCVVHHDGRELVYYTGWTLGGTVPFTLYAGCAVSDDDGKTFSKVSAGPLLDRDDVDPFLTASPWVLVEEGRWRMWYVSGTGWRVVDGEPRHWYHVKYAESDDGIEWRRDGTVCIDYESEREHAISRPCVVRDRDVYRMWFSARGDAYRFGYAESTDGIHWERRDEDAGLPPSHADWSDEMQCYPAVLDHGGRRFLFYNGNGFGATGIGWAEAE